MRKLKLPLNFSKGLITERLPPHNRKQGEGTTMEDHKGPGPQQWLTTKGTRHNKHPTKQTASVP